MEEDMRFQKMEESIRSLKNIQESHSIVLDRHSEALDRQSEAIDQLRKMMREIAPKLGLEVQFSKLTDSSAEEISKSTESLEDVKIGRDGWKLEESWFEKTSFESFSPKQILDPVEDKFVREEERLMPASDEEIVEVVEVEELPEGDKYEMQVVANEGDRKTIFKETHQCKEFEDRVWSNEAFYAKAHHLFDEIPRRNVYSWKVILSGYLGRPYQIQVTEYRLYDANSRMKNVVEQKMKNVPGKWESEMDGEHFVEEYSEMVDVGEAQHSYIDGSLSDALKSALEEIILHPFVAIAPQSRSDVCEHVSVNTYEFRVEQLSVFAYLAVVDSSTKAPNYNQVIHAHMFNYSSVDFYFKELVNREFPDSNVFELYFKSYKVIAHYLFDKMPRMEVYSWKVILSGYRLRVDELKVFKEEELVDMAMKEAFMDEERIQNSSQHSEGHSDAGKSTCLEGSGGRDTEASFKSSNDSPSGNSCNGTMNKNNSRKRKRRKADSRALESSYIAKVEQLAKIKQKQDEDKAAAVLHSFNGSCKNNECAIPSSEKIEMMKSLRFTNTATKVKSSNIREHTTVMHPEVVLCVEVYHNIKTWVKTQEFLVLGQQYLTELRDSIYCSTDQVMQKAGQHDPSGYFLIEDVFCNDMRDPSAIDYSEPIFDWLRNSKDEALRKWECIMTGELQQKQKEVIGDIRISRLPHFKAVDMHKARFCDLRFRLGAGYLYCHQGDCKHTIVIRDVRLIHPEDVHNRAAYPICIFQLRLRLQKCSVCKIYRAEKVTVDDKWASENPCYFCKDCYYLLHYGKDNSLLYSDFSVYDYHHD